MFTKEQIIIKSVKKFLNDIYYDLSINESEVNSDSLIVLDTLLSNITNEVVLKSIINELDSSQELNEFKNPFKKTINDKIKNFAKDVWSKQQNWVKNQLLTLNNIKDPKKRKKALLKFRDDNKKKNIKITKLISVFKKVFKVKLRK
jgi:hypothetical protein